MPFTASSTAVSNGTGTLIYTAADDDQEVSVMFAGGSATFGQIGGSSGACSYLIPLNGANQSLYQWQSRVQAGDTLYATCNSGTCTAYVMVRSA